MERFVLICFDLYKICKFYLFLYVFLYVFLILHCVVLKKIISMILIILYFSSSNIKTIETIVNADLKRVSNWLRLNKLSHTWKTEFILFQVGRRSLKPPKTPERQLPLKKTLNILEKNVAIPEKIQISLNNLNFENYVDYQLSIF